MLRLKTELLCSVLLLQANKAAQAQGNALPLGFHPDMHTLLVGDGNMSFARALARLFEGDGSCLVATAYDSEEQTQLKYEVGCDGRSACGTAPAWWWQGSLAQCGRRLVGFTCTSSSMRSNVPAHAPQGCGGLMQSHGRCCAVIPCGSGEWRMHRCQAGLLQEVTFVHTYPSILSHLFHLKTHA